MKELSIIIPIYNTPESALKRCFDSVRTLQGINYEVLLIDDGSAPATGEYCRGYAAEDCSFSYHYQDNGGVSAARNAGLRLARGRYVTFLDADDTLLGQVIRPELLAEEHSLVVFDLLLIQNRQQAVWHALDREAGVWEQSALLSQLVRTKSMNSPCAKLFLTENIRRLGLSFDTGYVTGEDWRFVCDYVQNIDSALYCREACYCYYRDGGTSLSRLSRFPDTMLDNQDAMFRHKQVLLQLPSMAGQEQLMNIAAADYVEVLFNIAADLLLLGKLTDQRKDRIRGSAQAAASLLSASAPKKTGVKLQILLRHWYAVHPIALARRLYLKMKH